MTILFLVLGVALLILIHEAGHFFAAKLMGVKVDEFGVGFPPRLLSKKIGETRYSLNLIPFGGFVRLYGETGGGGAVNDNSPDRERAFFKKSAWRRVLIISAGVLMNFLVAWIFFAGIFYVGALDPDLRVFDIIMHTEFGTTYNAYVVKGKEKTALFETVKVKFFDSYLEKLKEIIDVTKIDYIVFCVSVDMLLAPAPNIPLSSRERRYTCLPIYSLDVSP